MKNEIPQYLQDGILAVGVILGVSILVGLVPLLFDFVELIWEWSDLFWDGELG